MSKATIIKEEGTTAYHADSLSAGANALIEASRPYEVEIEITGTADLILNRFNPEEYEEKRASAKGSKVRSTDVPENAVYRDMDGVVCLPGVYMSLAIAKAAKSKSDPRSPRKSAMELYKAAVFATQELSPILSVTGETSKDGWDYLDKRGACVNRARVLKTRPAFFKGWKCTFRLAVEAPEYISPDDLLSVAMDAGKFGGMGDYRPTYGRFQVTSFQVVTE